MMHNGCSSGGFPVSTLDYAPYTPRADMASNCLLVGLAVVLIVMTLSRPASPIYHPVAHQASAQVTSMIATVGHAVSARLETGLASLGSGNVMPANASLTTSNLPSDTKVKLIDCAKSKSDKDAWKSMTDAEKAACEKAARSVVASHPKAVFLFYAPWCPHCHSAMAGFSEAAASASVPFYMVNAEALPRSAFVGPKALLALEYFPTFAVLKEGKLAATEVASPKDLVGAVEDDTAVAPAPAAAPAEASDEGEMLKRLFA